MTADPLGTLELDFGPRRFAVKFDRDLTPFLIDGSGARLATLPKPTRTDDPVKAREAAEHWKALRKAARICADEQLVELEAVMGSERRFSSEVFEATIVGHPVVTQLAQRLVWEVVGPALPRLTFRVLEDRSFVHVDDRPFTLPDDASVGLVHRLALDDEVVAAWLDHFSRHEVLQPFDQLERTTYTITDPERDSPLLERIKGMTVRTSKVLRLEQRGWRKQHRGHLSRFMAASSQLHERFGTTERPLDVYHFALAYYSCTWFGVEVTQTMTYANCNAERSMELDFDFPMDAMQSGSGSFSGRATEFAFPDGLDGTQDVTFEATNVDPPMSSSARIAGRFVSNAPGWSLDLPIDLPSVAFNPSCTLSTH